MPTTPESEGLSADARRDLVRGGIALIAFLVLSLGLLLWMNPVARWKLLGTLIAPRAGSSLTLTVAHTNDTWGYTLPCG